MQDGASTDGTLEYLGTIDGPARDVDRVRAGQRDRTGVQPRRAALPGEIVGSVDADNLLRPDALDIVVRRFAEHPHAAVIYGACDMIDGERAVHPLLESAGVRSARPDGRRGGAAVRDVVLLARACGDDLRFDEEFRTVADFELWLRLAHLPIVRIFDVLADVRVGDQSSTWNAANYDNQCGYKIRALEKLLERPTAASACSKSSTSARRPASTCGPSIRWRSSAAGRSRSIGISRKLRKPICARNVFAMCSSRARPRLPGRRALARPEAPAGVRHRVPATSACRTRRWSYFEFLQTAGVRSRRTARLARARARKTGGRRRRRPRSPNTCRRRSIGATGCSPKRSLVVERGRHSRRDHRRAAAGPGLDAARMAPLHHRQAAIREAIRPCAASLERSSPAGPVPAPTSSRGCATGWRIAGRTAPASGASPDRRCTLGHRRLSIIDLSADGGAADGRTTPARSR